MTKDLIAALRKAHDEAGLMPQGTMEHETQWVIFAALYNAASNLLDAIEHPEWEYALRLKGEIVRSGDLETLEGYFSIWGGQIDRRRAAGPWEEVSRG